MCFPSNVFPAVCRWVISVVGQHGVVFDGAFVGISAWVCD